MTWSSRPPAGVASIAPLVRFDGVGFRYPTGPEVLTGISLTVRRDDFIGIVGPSGSGKTTLLRLLLRSVRPTTGAITGEGVRTGYVPQVETINWNFPVDVFEAVAMASHARRTPWTSPAERRRITAVLDRLELGGLARRHIRELSGGQQQRVFVARALLSDPDLLVLDEPTSGVDVRTRHEILHLLADLHREGLAVVVSTHDLNGIAAHLPTIACLQRTLIAVGSPAETLTSAVLERTFGAPMDVLVHAGLPLVVDARHHPHEVRGS